MARRTSRVPLCFRRNVVNLSKSHVILKKGRERSLLNRHPWIFSGAIQTLPQFEDGQLLPVMSSSGEMLCTAYVNRASSITARVVAWVDEDAHTALRKNFEAAWALRRALVDFQRTNAYRLINAEGDGIPGLIVDVYAGVAVMQIGTLGAERLRDFFIEQIREKIQPLAILERSLLPSRAEEGLSDCEKVHFGSVPAEIEILENGVRCIVSFEHAQKTGFFLDQREMRALVETLARGRNVLNCFSFSGAFSVFAARGGARATMSVDVSKGAIELAQRNLALNHFTREQHRCVAADVFEFLRTQGGGYDLIILDPPAFAKKKAHIAQAAKGYNDINRVAMEKISPGGIIVTCSCSHFVDEDLFRKIIFSAARDAGRKVRIVHKHRQAFDHPVSVFHPEGEYLKGLVLAVD